MLFNTFNNVDIIPILLNVRTLSVVEVLREELDDLLPQIIEFWY
jgi:hypothetical protein